MPRKKRAKQNCHNYTLRDGRIVVKHGTTCRRPTVRKEEMKSSGLRFSTMIRDSIAVSKKTALKREKERIRAYQKSHKGRNPRYNK